MVHYILIYSLRQYSYGTVIKVSLKYQLARTCVNIDATWSDTCPIFGRNITNILTAILAR